MAAIIPSVVCCHHVNLHSIETMMGVHAAKMGQNKTLHGRN
jgi:hypothetical protein